jgi:hypothetical protein
MTIKITAIALMVSSSLLTTLSTYAQSQSPPSIKTSNAGTPEKIAADISKTRIEATIRKLAGFGTRCPIR